MCIKRVNFYQEKAGMAMFGYALIIKNANVSV